MQLPGIDIRPLAPRVDGTLRLDGPDREGRTFVSATSGLTAVGGKLWAVSDEYGELLRFDRPDAPGHAHAGLSKQKGKPDLEAVTFVPASGAAPGMVVAIGSGSKADRARAVAQDVDAAGLPVGAPRAIDLAPLYASLAPHLPLGPNVEGLAVRSGADGAELLVFHRGKLAGDRNTIFRLDASSAVDALRRGVPIPPSAVRGHQVVDLGTLGGARLGFADATSLPDGRIAFVASSEGSDSTGDGEIHGSVVGILERDLSVSALRPLTGPPRKVEGIELASRLDPTAPASRFVLVTDPDDPKAATERMTVEL